MPTLDDSTAAGEMHRYPKPGSDKYNDLFHRRSKERKPLSVAVNGFMIEQKVSWRRLL